MIFWVDKIVTIGCDYFGKVTFHPLRYLIPCPQSVCNTRKFLDLDCTIKNIYEVVYTHHKITILLWQICGTYDSICIKF